MGRRSGISHTPPQVEASNDPDLEAEIARVRGRLSVPNRQMLTKAFHKQLHLLEKVRAKRAEAQ